MIRAEDVADLREGDEVELRLTTGTIIRGPLTDEHGAGYLGIAGAGWNVRNPDDSPAFHVQDGVESVTIISRAPRPLYVNHSRTEPVPGDVVGPPDEEGPLPGWRPTWARSVDGVWVGTHTGRPIAGEMLDRLRLLVDGETGQVVP